LFEFDEDAPISPKILVREDWMDKDGRAATGCPPPPQDITKQHFI
jgi:hypothetical protein